MFFLLRMAFWLGVVLILLPSGGAVQRPGPSELGASDAFSAASATVNDVKGFCTRQPDACTVASRVAVAIGYRAQAGAKMLYDFLTESLAPRATGSLADADKSTPTKLTTQHSSQNTLTPADLNPAWRGPRDRREAKHAAKLSG